MSEEATNVVSPPSESEGMSYDALKELFLTAVAVWSKCDQALIKNRLVVLWMAHRAFVYERPSVGKQFRLDYNGDFVKPTSSSESFTENENRILLLFFDYSIGCLVKVGIKVANDCLINKRATAEQIGIMRNILMLPAVAGIIKPIARNDGFSYCRYEARMPKGLRDAMNVLMSRSQPNITPSEASDTSTTVSLPASSTSSIRTDEAILPLLMIREDTLPLPTDGTADGTTDVDMEESITYTAPAPNQIAARLVDDLSIDLPSEVLPFDEVVEGRIIAVNPSSTSHQDNVTCVISWVDGTTESMPLSDAVEAIEVHQSLDQWTMRHSSIGTHVAKHFDGGLYYGQVIRFAPDDDGIAPLYHVEWSDGDSEDLDWDGFRQASALYNRKKNDTAFMKQITKTNARKFIFIENKLQVKIGMKVARLLPLKLLNKMPAPVKSFPDILAESLFISKKAPGVEFETVTTKHPSIDKKVCRVLSLRNHVNKAVHRDHLLQGIITGYIAVSSAFERSVELYRVKWDDIEEQQWLNYSEVAKCTPLKSEAKRLTMSVPTKPKRRRLMKNVEVVVEEKKHAVTADEDTICYCKSV